MRTHERTISEDLLVDMVDEFLNTHERCDAPGISDEEAERLYARSVELDAQIEHTRPTTIAGAIAALRMAENEYRRHILDDEEPSGQDRIIMAMLTGTIDLLCRLGANEEIAKDTPAVNRQSRPAGL